MWCTWLFSCGLSAWWWVFIRRSKHVAVKLSNMWRTAVTDRLRLPSLPWRAEVSVCDPWHERSWMFIRSNNSIQMLAACSLNLKNKTLAVLETRFVHFTAGTEWRHSLKGITTVLWIATYVSLPVICNVLGVWVRNRWELRQMAVAVVMQPRGSYVSVGTAASYSAVTPRSLFKTLQVHDVIFCRILNSL